VSAAEPVAGAGEPKRARLRGKQPAPAAYVRLPTTEESSLLDRAVGSPAGAAADAAGIAPQAPAVEGGADQGDVDNLALSRRFHQFYRRWQLRLEKGPGSEDADARLQHLRYGGLRSMTAQARAEAVRVWAAADTWADPEVRAWALEYFERKSNEVGGACRRTWYLRARAFLLTWNGTWGLFTMRDITGADGLLPISELCVLLKKHPRVQALQLKFAEFLESIADFTQSADVAYSIEICTRSYEAALEASAEATSPAQVRLHVHASFRNGYRMELRRADRLRFCGSMPVKSTHDARRGSAQCLYYVQCPKKGMVLSGGSVAPYRDYLVNGEWIMNLCQAGKMEYDTARLELIRSAKNLCRLLPGLEKWKRERDALTLEARIATVESELARSRKPFKQLPVVLQWLESFATVRMRYKFLVLDGPSAMGKTQYSSSLSPSGNLLAVDCAGAGVAPDLRDFDALVHDAVLFDEASAQLVLTNKKLFQAGPGKVTLCSSGTNCHAYAVWMFQKRLIVSTNRWALELVALPAVDRDWLVQNSVHVCVQEPLWLEDEQ